MVSKLVREKLFPTKTGVYRLKRATKKHIDCCLLDVQWQIFLACLRREHNNYLCNRQVLHCGGLLELNRLWKKKNLLDLNRNIAL